MTLQGKKKAKRRRDGWRRQFAYRLEYLGLRVVARLVTALPVAAASAVMGRLWQRIGPFTARQARVDRNLALVLPETSGKERRRISAAQWNNLGRTFAETLHLKRMAEEPERRELAVSKDLDAKLLRPGQGAVFVSSHSANWEAAGYPLRRYGTLMGLYQKLSNPLSDRFLTSLREISYSGGMLPKDKTTPGRVMRWVRSGNPVAMLTDLYEKRGIPVTFFGQPTRANPFPAMLARRLGVPLVLVRTIRLPHARFQLELEEVAVPVTGSMAADVQACTQTIMARFEAWIRDRPGEWMWVQNRWPPERSGTENDAKSATATQLLSGPR